MTGLIAEFLPVLLLGVVAGVAGGMFGIGGGLIIVPALMLIFGLPIKTATGTSLFAMLWPVGILGVVEYWKSDELNPWYGAAIAVGLVAGMYFGARITLALSPMAMKRCYAVFLLVVGSYYVWTTLPGSPVDTQRPTVLPAPDPRQVH